MKPIENTTPKEDIKPVEPPVEPKPFVNLWDTLPQNSKPSFDDILNILEQHSKQIPVSEELKEPETMIELPKSYFHKFNNKIDEDANSCIKKE